MQTWFHDIADHIQTRLTGDEVYLATMSGETSDFVRFNQARVRQAGAVSQRSVSIDLILGQRHACGSLVLGGDLEEDKKRIDAFLPRLRSQREAMPEDPYLLYAQDVVSTESVGERGTPDPADAMEQIQASAGDRDLVGIFAVGGVHAGFANSLGQRNWFSTRSHHLDWCFYHQKDKAVKTSYAGFSWDEAALAAKVEEASRKLEALAQPAKKIGRGDYRVFLTPSAVQEILSMLCWGGFGLKRLKSRSTPLLRLAEGHVSMDPRLSIRENTADGVAPNFQEAGFLRPDRVELIREGTHADSLVSPRSAREFGVATNGASSGEQPESLDMDGGGLASDKIVETLGTGLYVGNLWYLNFSDFMACKTTGMTRFATFWVENGEVQAPVDVMRFDESVYRMFGENLVDLTAEREWLLDADTYGARATSSARVPGALVEDFAFTL